MRSILTVALVIVSLSLLAQPAYRIEMKIKGLKDTTGYLAFQFWEQTYIRDTARFNSKGEILFDGKTALGQGVYFLVLNKTKTFEFVVGQNQKFSLSTSTEDFVRNMVVTGDVDNKLFFENMVFNAERHKEAEPFIKIAQDSSSGEEAKKEARTGYAKINDKVTAYQDEIISRYPETVTARRLKTTKAVIIPDPPRKANGTIDSTFQLRWYREHYFDNFDLADEALLRMPPGTVYRDKMYEYLDKLYLPHPDSVMKGITFIVSKAKKNKETYKYAVLKLVQKYELSNIMGLDRVFVNLVDRYFTSGEMDYWANEKLRKNLKDAADRMRKSLVGETGPNLIMQDAKFAKRAMYDIRNKYTILWIFDPDCPHCKEETPHLVEFYNQNRKKLDIEVFAVSTDTSMAKMRKFVDDMKATWITVNGPRSYLGPHQDLYDAQQTPTLYILDEKKKIIGKKLSPENLGDFFIAYERVEKLKVR
jgi:thiol-disulfide isomerase/thioredoxin